MRRFLSKEGMEVHTALSAEEGIQKAKRLRPTAITLDVMMPGRDGWSTLTELKSASETSDIPVIMVTMLDDRSRGFALGATDFVTKPVEWGKLVSIISRYAGRPPGHPILVVEDDDETREMVCRLLARQNLPVVEAANGREALDRMAEQVPALILLDLIMPELDGFGFVEELRRHAEWLSIPIVVLTAADIGEEERRRLNGQVMQIIRKVGQGTDELLEDIRSWLELFVTPPATNV